MPFDIILKIVTIIWNNINQLMMGDQKTHHFDKISDM